MLSFQIEKEVTDLMTKALKYCSVDCDVTAANDLLRNQYRCATIHHRLASLYHNSLKALVQIMMSPTYIPT